MRQSAILPKDRQGHVIQSCTVIPWISNVSITTSAYVALSVPKNTYCKSVVIKTRAGNAFRLATSANPSEYITFTSPVSFNLTGTGQTVYAYVRADTTSDTLEIMYMD